MATASTIGGFYSARWSFSASDGETSPLTEIADRQENLQAAWHWAKMHSPITHQQHADNDACRGVS